MVLSAKVVTGVFRVKSLDTHPSLLIKGSSGECQVRLDQCRHIGKKNKTGFSDTPSLSLRYRHALPLGQGRGSTKGQPWSRCGLTGVSFIVVVVLLFAFQERQGFSV